MSAISNLHIEYIEELDLIKFACIELQTNNKLDSKTKRMIIKGITASALHLKENFLHLI